MRNTYSKFKLKSKLQIYVTILITLFTFLILITNSVLYAQAENEFVLGCFITLRGEITCSDTSVAPTLTKISIYDANKTSTLVKEVIVQGGSYEINLDPGIYCIYYASEGYSTYVSNEITVTRASVYTNDIVFQKPEEASRPVSVVFTITDKNGVPFSNCEAFINMHKDYVSYIPNASWRGRTDTNGRCVLNVDLIEGKYTVSVFYSNKNYLAEAILEKSTAEILNDSYVQGSYYHIPVKIDCILPIDTMPKTAVLPDDVYFENGIFNSKYVGDDFDFNSCGILRGPFDDVYWGIIYGDAKEYIDAGLGFQAIGTNAEPWIIEDGELVHKQTVFGTSDESTSKIYLPIDLEEYDVAKYGPCLNITMELSGFHGKYEDGIHNRLWYIKYPAEGRIDALETGYIGPCEETNGYIDAYRGLVPNDETLVNFISFRIESYEEVRIKKIWITNSK
ncbi:MAG: hypothetical protein J6O73_04825 [Lachnospiraceae bacterium]|nr:hypothetical protein [Lachnospiraceae bacterium]